jgi:hypothetical protein
MVDITVNYYHRWYQVKQYIPEDFLSTFNPFSLGALEWVFDAVHVIRQVCGCIEFGIDCSI